MTQNKKSFILHIDTLGILDELSDEQAGQLFKKIYNYNNPNNPKETQITQLVNLAFYPFKTQFDRDFEAYQRVVERNRNNGNKGGRPVSVNPSKAKKPDSDKDKDSDNGKVKENNIEERKLKFASTLTPFKSKYSNELLLDFYKYWTEHNKSNSKFRQELEKTWSLERRLETWSKNEKYFGKNKEEPVSESKGKLPLASLAELNKPIN